MIFLLLTLQLQPYKKSDKILNLSMFDDSLKLKRVRKGIHNVISIGKSSRYFCISFIPWILAAKIIRGEPEWAPNTRETWSVCDLSHAHMLICTNERYKDRRHTSEVQLCAINSDRYSIKTKKTVNHTVCRKGMLVWEFLWLCPTISGSS